MADDDDYRIDALRQELMRQIDAVRNDLDKRQGSTEASVTVIKWLLVALVAVFSLITAILAAAANII